MGSRNPSVTSLHLMDFNLKSPHLSSFPSYTANASTESRRQSAPPTSTGPSRSPFPGPPPVERLIHILVTGGMALILASQVRYTWNHYLIDNDSNPWTCPMVYYWSNGGIGMVLQPLIAGVIQLALYSAMDLRKLVMIVLGTVGTMWVIRRDGFMGC